LIAVGSSILNLTSELQSTAAQQRSIYWNDGLEAAANRKYQHASPLADAPLAAGNVGLDANGDVIYSQTLDLEVDLGMIDLHSRS
jgi:hypothetical protein